MVFDHNKNIDKIPRSFVVKRIIHNFLKTEKNLRKIKIVKILLK